VIAGIVLFQQMLNIGLEMAGARVYFTGEIEMTGPPNLLVTVFTKINPVMLAFILFSWMPYARIINTMVLGLKETEYVQAARALGAGHTKIIVRHLIPNSISPAVVLLARDIGGLVLLQATFTFIGLGGNSTWGRLLVDGRDWIIGAGGNVLAHWWVFVPATLALVLFGVCWNLLGDGLNDWLNPRTT
jgi:peptide/nickel transport system permease protein